MADFKEFKVKLVVDTSDGTKNVETTINSLEDYNKILDDLNKKKTKPGISKEEIAAIDKEIVNLGKNFTDSGNKINKSLDASQANLKILKKELKNVTAGTPEFTRLKEEINDMEDALKSSGQGADNFAEIIGTLPGPIGDIGNKVGGLIDNVKIFSGIKLDAIKGSFKALGSDILTTGSQLLKLTGIEKLYTITTVLMSKALKLVGIEAKTSAIGVKIFSAALVSTGIGAIVVGLGMLISYFMTLGEESDKTADSVAKMNAAIANTDRVTKQRNAEELARAKAKGATETELYKIKKRQDEEELERARTAFNEATVLIYKGRKNEEQATEGYKAALVARSDAAKKIDELKSQILIDGYNEEARINGETKKNNEKTDAAKIKGVKEVKKVIVKTEEEILKERKEGYEKLLTELDKYLDKEEDKILKRRTQTARKETQLLTEKLIEGQITQEEFDKTITENNIKTLQQKQKDDDAAGTNRLAQLQINYAAQLLGFDEYINAYREQEALNEELNIENENVITEARLARDLQYKQKQLDNEKGFATMMAELDKAYTDAVIQNKMAVADAVGSLGGVLQSLAGDSKELAIVGLLLEKAAAIAQVVINSNAVAFNIRKAYTTQPPTIGIPPFIFPNPAFFIETATRNSLLAANRIQAGISIGAIGLSAGTGIAGINAASKAKAEKKQFGGILQGPLHQNGGITTPYGELEGGEYVVNRASTMMFRPTLDRINGLGGGVGDLTTSGNNTTFNDGNTVIKTYVVASDMSSQQEIDRIIKQRSKL
ncbi:hypothetical protein UFOVP1479_32 [uncultured Caudovirales phage]|uniref:Uncharacterized protein n=1 Tax=uncultured Caudovirales phage TaxID=2100421 RepID=A0A6J5MZK0_9CAUD|nr:hypothetical protein UFOVP310_34 [uncultured Caudovirales phage]CAB4152314.1 hypothetical protein UFOVP619_12 [uncultured Caudovirales phage]CAB4173155.1 hypothetical protein UFOVP947_35 [uncultured Caudovirales phage]CAB4184525.1 hypothetical protein UFOVP1114_15 [uncultured Caudovirales phage]CAB4204032.1 hypothetical protein UFOVP1386_15 [uncultured Caudovirales phage]